MKVVNKLALLMIMPLAASAQPMAADCSSAIHTYISFNQASTEVIRKNSVMISYAARNEDSRNWFESPMMKLQAEAARNFLKLKKGLNKRNKCTLNYALYQNISNKLSQLSINPELHSALSTILATSAQKRTPANFSATLLASKERSPSELRSARRKIGIVAQALNSNQADYCLEKMIETGSLKALSNSEAAELYAHYLNNYIISGGKVSQYLNAPLLSKVDASADQPSDPSLKENLEALREITQSTKIYLVRQSFAACPLNGSDSIKILVPKNVQVSGSLGQNELVHEDPSLWNSTEAIQYSNTAVEKYPSVALKNKVFNATFFLENWIKESQSNEEIANR